MYCHITHFYFVPCASAGIFANKIESEKRSLLVTRMNFPPFWFINWINRFFCRFKIACSSHSSETWNLIFQSDISDEMERCIHYISQFWFRKSLQNDKNNVNSNGFLINVMHMTCLNMRNGTPFLCSIVSATVSMNYSKLIMRFKLNCWNYAVIQSLKLFARKNFHSFQT